MSSIANKLNPLSYARIASFTAKSIVSLNTDSTEAALALLESAIEETQSMAAKTFLESQLAMIQLSSLNSTHYANTNNAELLNKIRLLLQKGKQRLNLKLDNHNDSDEKSKTRTRDLSQVQSVTSGSELALVYSAHYEASMMYRKQVGPPDAFYNDALMYLSYTNVNDIPKEDAYTLATDLSLAALTGEGVFHFGEVVNSVEILQVLEGTPNAWLMELMKCCAQGDVDKFMQVTSQSDVREKIEAQPALMARADTVKEKITLLSLVNLIFERPANERNLSFDDIAMRCKLSDTGDVEKLVMRALSLGLIRGSMDQVDQLVFVTWVMPRVLDLNQMTALSCRFGEWAVKSSKVADFMNEHATNI